MSSSTLTGRGRTETSSSTDDVSQQLDSIQNDEQQSIAQLAYVLWQQRGCPIGSSDQDWIEAENQLRQQQPNPTVAAAASGR